MKTLELTKAAEWRRWLAANHDRVSEIWLVFHKRHTGRESIAYLDALDEALCFGWIDSLVKRLDDDRYARKFTPRTPDSRWSAVNRRRYAALAAAGCLAAPGLRRAPTSRGYSARPTRAGDRPLPRYIALALRREPAARQCFDRLAPSYRRQYIAWIDSAKREETKQKRLQEAIRLLAAGRKLGLK